MKIIISNTSSIPIYEQIKNTIINQIISSELEQEDKNKCYDNKKSL